MNLFMTPLSFVPALFFWTWPTWETWGVFLVLGFFAAVSHIFLTRSYARADSSAVQPYDYLRLPFVALFGYIVFDEVPTIWILPGAALIVGSAIYIARREAVIARERRIAKAAAEATGEAA